MWPTGELGPHVRMLVDGAWSGLAGSVVGFLMFLAGFAFVGHDAASVLVDGLRLAAVGLGLGPPFSWFTARINLPLLPSGIVYALAFTAGYGAFSARIVVPVIVYGATMGLVLREVRRSRATTSEPGT